MLKTNKRYTIAPCQHRVEAKLYNTCKMNHTGHSVWGHILGHEECNPCIVALRGQCIQQQLLTRGPKHPFSQTSRFGLPNGSPNWLNQSWGPVLPSHFREQLFNHLLEHFKFCATPPSGEEWGAHLGSVHECTINVVQHIMKHSQIHRHHYFPTKMKNKHTKTMESQRISAVVSSFISPV